MPYLTYIGIGEKNVDLDNYREFGMRKFVCIAYSAAFLVASPKVLASEETKHGKELETGRRDYNVCVWETDQSRATLYDLHRLDISDSELHLSSSVKLIVKQHTTRISCYPAVSRFIDLKIDSASKLFGQPISQGLSKRDTNLGLVIYQMKGFGPLQSKLAVFDIEVETDKNGNFLAYRVQGPGIKNSDWQVM